MNQAIAQPLIAQLWLVALAVIMHREISGRLSNEPLPTQNQPIEARFFDAPSEHLSLRIQVRASWRQLRRRELNSGLYDSFPITAN
jgi:hypothetical protein